MVEQVTMGSCESIVVVRDGRRVTLEVPCREQPKRLGIGRSNSHGTGHKEPSHFDRLGLTVETLTAEVAEFLGAGSNTGVLITSVQPGSPAERAGLTVAMIITQEERQPLQGVDDFRRMLAGKPREESLLLLVDTDSGSRFVVLRARPKDTIQRRPAKHGVCHGRA